MMHTKYTIATILKKNKANKQGQLPIYIRITIARKVNFFSTGHYILPQQWDNKNQLIKNTHPLAQQWNSEIALIKTSLVNKLLQAQIAGNPMSANQLKSASKHNTNYHNIFEFTNSFIEEVQHKRQPGTLENYRKHLLKLELYHKSTNLNFEEINADYLSKFEHHLRQTVGNNYTHAILKTLRTIFNAAIKRGFITKYPFQQYEMPIYRSPDKDYLNTVEIAKMLEYATTTANTIHQQAATYFLLGCYTGLRISDWHRFTPNNKTIPDGKTLVLQAHKNKEWITIPISKPLAQIIELIKQLPLTIKEPTINEKLKIIAAHLGIQKRITTHTGRHTFAVTICLGNGISSETTAKLMGITLPTFLNNYSQIVQAKIAHETTAAWANL